jgi:hypothetical protein
MLHQVFWLVLVVACSGKNLVPCSGTEHWIPLNQTPAAHQDLHNTEAVKITSEAGCLNTPSNCESGTVSSHIVKVENGPFRGETGELTGNYKYLEGGVRQEVTAVAHTLFSVARLEAKLSLYEHSAPPYL